VKSFLSILFVMMLQSDVSIDVKLDTFNVIPSDIEGGCCCFYLSTKDKLENKYICVNDFADIAYLKINGKMERFELTQFDEKTNIYSYSNKYFDFTIKTKKSDPDGSTVKGIIIVTNKKHTKTFSKNIIGFCGD
jgi:hypothetical protein